MRLTIGAQLIDLPPILGQGSAATFISITNAEVAENAALLDVIGTLSVVNGSGVYTFSITSDPDNKFDLDGDDLIVDGAFDYETATSHQVTVEADNGVDPPISRVLTIAVTDVEEGAGDFRITEGGDFRITEAGDFRILEAAAIGSFLVLSDGVSQLLLSNGVDALVL